MHIKRVRRIIEHMAGNEAVKHSSDINQDILTWQRKFHVVIPHIVKRLWNIFNILSILKLDIVAMESSKDQNKACFSWEEFDSLNHFTCYPEVLGVEKSCQQISSTAIKWAKWNEVIIVYCHHSKNECTLIFSLDKFKHSHLSFDLTYMLWVNQCFDRFGVAKIFLTLVLSFSWLQFDLFANVSNHSTFISYHAPLKVTCMPFHSNNLEETLNVQIKRGILHFPWKGENFQLSISTI